MSVWCGPCLFQTEQLELRRKEEQAARQKAHAKQQATREMFARSIELAKQKRDKERHEEMVYDMKLLEETLKSEADEALAIQQRKVIIFPRRSYYSVCYNDDASTTTTRCAQTDSANATCSALAAAMSPSGD